MKNINDSNKLNFFNKIFNFEKVIYRKSRKTEL